MMTQQPPSQPVSNSLTKEENYKAQHLIFFSLILSKTDHGKTFFDTPSLLISYLSKRKIFSHCLRICNVSEDGITQSMSRTLAANGILGSIRRGLEHKTALVFSY